MRDRIRVVIFAALMCAAAVIWSSVPESALAQDEPEATTPPENPVEESVEEPIGPRIDAIRSAMSALVSNADSGVWQAADESFNALLDALDLHREPLLRARPDVAPEVFAQLDTLLVDLDAALSAEDPIRVRAIDGLVDSWLARLAPIAASGSSANPAAAVVLEWREADERIEALALASRWRDMRNEAIALIEDIERRSGIVASALGEGGGQLDLERVQVFALLLRSASLDQSAEGAARATKHFDRAIQGLLEDLGLVALPTPTVESPSVARFRGFEVSGAVGQTVIVPIKAEGVPRIGLGSFEMRALWSPSALAFVEAQPGEVGRGLRSEASAGRVDLSLDQAPVGPAGDAIVASLVFEVIGDEIDARDYLPRDVIEAIESAVRDSVSLVKLGDLPKAAAEVSRAHDEFAEGRGLPGTSFSRLQVDGSSEAIERRFLSVLRLLSRPEPAPSDEIVVALALLQSEFGQAIARHFERITSADSIPILIEVLEARDASGQALPLRDAVPGQVAIAASALPDADIPTPGLSASELEGMDLGLVTPPPLESLESSFPAVPPVDGEGGPMPLLIAIAAAALIAALAAAAMARGDRSSDA